MIVKLFKLLFILSLYIAITGCINEKSEDLILGRWEYVDNYDNRYLDFYQDGTVITGDSDFKLVGQYIFMDDSNFRMEFKDELGYDLIIVYRINKINKDELILENLDYDEVITLTRFISNIESPTSTEQANTNENYVVVATASIENGETIIITFNGGPDASKVKLIEYDINGYHHTISRRPNVGDRYAYLITPPSPFHVIVTSTFDDGTQQVILDTYVE